MSIRIGILGYGNLGRGVESAIAHNEDMELVGVFTRRNPENVKVRTAGVKVLEASELEHMQDQIDVLVLCGGSATDLPAQTPKYAADYNVVDSFDTHAYLNDLRSGNAAKESEVFQRRLDRYRERYIFPENETTPTEEKQG